MWFWDTPNFEKQLSNLIGSHGSYNRGWAENTTVVNIVKFTIPGSAIYDQWILGNHLPSLDQRFSFPHHTPFCDMGKLEQSVASDFPDLDHNKKFILHCVPAHTQTYPLLTESKGFYLWCTLIFSILFFYSVLKSPSKLISHLLMGQLQVENPGFDYFYCPLSF